jgi:hypothetical protein
MNKICTSIDQSKKLIELGIDINTADMCYCPIMDIDSMSNTGFLEIPECYPFSEVKECRVQYLPAWSLSALLKLIPITCVLSINSGHYRIASNETNTFFHNNPLDATFEMVCWLKENGKI